MTDNYFTRNVTPLDELPDLQDLERGSNMNRVQKFIRNTHNGGIHPNSGMIDVVPVVQQQQQQQQPPLPVPAQIKMPMFQPHPYQEEEKESFHYYPHHQQPTCLEIANHVKHCPICSRFYNNDRTLYIITIIVLAIICLMLLKRVLNV